MIDVGQKSTSPRPIVQILKQLSKIILKTMEMMKSSFAAVTSRQNKVAASKKGIVTKHIAKWVVLGFLAILGGPKWHFGCRNQNSKTTFQHKYPPKNPFRHFGNHFGPRKSDFWPFYAKYAKYGQLLWYLTRRFGRAKYGPEKIMQNAVQTR